MEAGRQCPWIGLVGFGGRNKRSTAWFLPVKVQVNWGKWVSRYKFYNEQVMSHGTVILLTPLERSDYNLSSKLSRYQEWKAKTMTSLLIIPALLAKVCYFFNHHAGSIKKAESSLFFLSLGSIMVQKRVDYDLSDQQDLSIDKKL